ncbi:hypothetical protein Tco_0149653 [Tanacetum coccineum]
MNYYEPNPSYDSSGFDQPQPPQDSVDHQGILQAFRKIQEELEEIKQDQRIKENMSIEEMMREQLMVDDEIKDISNYLSYKRFRGEKIDDEYERDCEIKIEQLLQDYNGLGIKIQKKERILMEEKSLAVSRRIQSICDDDDDDDDDYEDVEYEEVNDVDQEEKEFDLEDIFQIQDVILREKLLNINRLISNIESLKDNPTPDCVLESPSSFPISVVDSDSLFEESDTSFSHSGNSLPEFESISDHTEETRSGSTTTHANYSHSEYDSFLFEIEPDQEGLISIVISDNLNDPLLELPEFESFHFEPSSPLPPPEPPDVEICLHFEPDAPVIDNFNELNDDQRGSEIDFSQNVEDDDSFTFVIRTFLPFLTYPEISPLSCSTGSEDTIFDPGIST